jgi:hypothetical protein
LTKVAWKDRVLLEVAEDCPVSCFAFASLPAFGGSPDHVANSVSKISKNEQLYIPMTTYKFILILLDHLDFVEVSQSILCD